MLHCHLLRSERDSVLLRSLDDRVQQFLVRGVRVGAAGQRDAAQVVGEGVIAHLRRNNLKSGVDDSDDGEKSDYSLNRAHVPQSALPGPNRLRLKRLIFIQSARAMLENEAF